MTPDFYGIWQSVFLASLSMIPDMNGLSVHNSIGKVPQHQKTILGHGSFRDRRKMAYSISHCASFTSWSRRRIILIGPRRKLKEPDEVSAEGHHNLDSRPPIPNSCISICLDFRERIEDTLVHQQRNVFHSDEIRLHIFNEP